LRPIRLASYAHWKCQFPKTARQTALTRSPVCEPPMKLVDVKATSIRANRTGIHSPRTERRSGAEEGFDNAEKVAIRYISKNNLLASRIVRLTDCGASGGPNRTTLVMCNLFGCVNSARRSPSCGAVRISRWVTVACLTAKPTRCWCWSVPQNWHSGFSVPATMDECGQ
jgi:hypothetical protein